MGVQFPIRTILLCILKGREKIIQLYEEMYTCTLPTVPPDKVPNEDPDRGFKSENSNYGVL